jgi:glycerophosphoryl diester phosphodiesterase
MIPSRPCRVPAGAAHRGASFDEPENTLAAFARAVGTGAPAIELDVHWTRDGVPVVIHDPTVDRTTGVPGRVDVLTAAEVGALDAGRGQRIPRLDAVLAMAARGGVQALVELKTVPTPEQARTLVAMLAESRASYVVHSFVPAALEAVRAAQPGAPVGLTTGEYVAPETAARYGSFFNVAKAQVDPARVAAWHGAGLKVYVWVADDPGSWEALTAAGVDGIVTDRIPEYMVWARAKCATQQ